MSTIRLLLLVAFASSTLILVAGCVVVEPAPVSTAGSLETVEEASEPDAPAAAPQPTTSTDETSGDSPSVGELGGTAWSLFAYGDPGSFQALASGSEITAEFSTDGQITGSAGCNRYMATFEVNGEFLAVGPIGLTRMMCTDESLRQQEQQFISALEGMAEGSEFRLVSDQLEIDLGDGMLLVFQSN